VIFTAPCLRGGKTGSRVSGWERDGYIYDVVGVKGETNVKNARFLHAAVSSPAEE
jgi:hypothetical protein